MITIFVSRTVCHTPTAVSKLISLAVTVTDPSLLISMNASEGELVFSFK